MNTGETEPKFSEILAHMVGDIKVGVEAQSEGGFDRNRLRNAVKEPLEESGIELKITEEWSWKDTRDD